MRKGGREEMVEKKKEPKKSIRCAKRVTKGGRRNQRKTGGIGENQNRGRSPIDGKIKGGSLSVP